MHRTKLLISGGGSLIQDVTSSKSLYYYLAVIRLAKLRGAKVMLYANGIGPIKNEKNTNAVRKALKSADVATLREQSSYEELKRLGVSVPSKVTADPVFSLQPSTAESTAAIIENAGIPNRNEYFIVAVRDWKKNAPNF